MNRHIAFLRGYCEFEDVTTYDLNRAALGNQPGPRSAATAGLTTTLPLWEAPPPKGKRIIVYSAGVVEMAKHAEKKFKIDES